MTEREQFERWISSLESWRSHAYLIHTFPNVAWSAWHAARRWIFITESLPENHSHVLIIAYGKMYHAYVGEGVFYTDVPYTDFLVDDISYWYPAPEMPREAE